MTPLLVTLGYLVVGTALARIVYVTDLHVKTDIVDNYERDHPFPLMVMVFCWPVILALTTAFLVIMGPYKLVTNAYPQAAQGGAGGEGSPAGAGPGVSAEAGG